MWAGCGTMGLCGWSGNSLFALQILQIFTMLGACSTAALWPTSLKCLHHSLIQIHQPPQLPSISWEEGRRWLSVEEIWISTSRLFARLDQPYLQSCTPPSLRDKNDKWEKQSSQAHVGSSQKNYAWLAVYHVFTSKIVQHQTTHNCFVRCRIHWPTRNFYGTFC